MYKNKKKIKKSTVVVMVVAFLIIMLSASYFILRKKEKLTIVESVIKDSGLFIEKTLLKPFQLMKKELTNQEMQELKKKADASEALKMKNSELEQQVKELKKTLELNTILSDRVYLNATAINRNMDYWYQIVTLDKGKRNGVESNMPVVVQEGLVGIISEVSQFNSSLKLLTMEEMAHKISVKIEVNDHYVYGILTGYNSKNKTLKVEGIAENTEIPLNSVVTTTGLGENMPAGIVVGYVKNITLDNFELAKLVEVESKVNFDSLSYVTILKRKDRES